MDSEMKGMTKSYRFLRAPKFCGDALTLNVQAYLLPCSFKVTLEALCITWFLTLNLKRQYEISGVVPYQRACLRT